VQVDDRFLFAVKGSRYLTHLKRLKAPSPPQPVTEPVTADFVYVRRHGTVARYHGS